MISSAAKLDNYSGTPIPVVGKCHCYCMFIGSKASVVEFQVMEGNETNPPVLGLLTIKQYCLVRRVLTVATTGDTGEQSNSFDGDSDPIGPIDKVGNCQTSTKPTQWVNSLVVVRKPDNSLRICLDPFKLNKENVRGYFHNPLLKSWCPKCHTLKCSQHWMGSRIDDLIIWGKYHAEHDLRLQHVLQRAKSKCRFNGTEVKNLGHKLSAEGIFPDEE
ncbi:hypothetical protein PR048_004786 [Dryococelus australis]|uniref:Uncharacterized protein n=1 Tax=Dryococelus australis TaxID=614101 RepID=A0ABQ9I791_9NEOP|nr:hypothetical protein PR048_004786 [Dryococelus australis]